jgi:Arc/MetJ-type ribon-helix-helix transcriptional regulator
VPKTKLAVTLDADLVEILDHLVAARQFASRSQVIESAVAEKLGRPDLRALDVGTNGRPRVDMSSLPGPAAPCSRVLERLLSRDMPMS